MFIHFTIATLVVIGAFIFKISKLEWILCILMISLVLASELINTSIEAVCDLVTDKENKYIKIAKDTAAGAVLIFSIASVLIGLLIFIPKVLEMVGI